MSQPRPADEPQTNPVEHTLRAGLGEISKLRLLILRTLPKAMFSTETQIMEILNELNLPSEIVQRIAEYAEEDVLDTLDWEAVCGTTIIYRTKHVLTYGGGPEGGYVYFYKEREAGWYEWRRDWGTPPTYTKVDGMLVQRFDEQDVELIAVAPYDFEYDGEEDIHILHDDLMQELDEA